MAVLAPVAVCGTGPRSDSCSCARSALASLRASPHALHGTTCIATGSAAGIAAGGGCRGAAVSAASFSARVLLSTMSSPQMSAGKMMRALRRAGDGMHAPIIWDAACCTMRAHACTRRGSLKRTVHEGVQAIVHPRSREARPSARSHFLEGRGRLFKKKARVELETRGGSQILIEPEDTRGPGYLALLGDAENRPSRARELRGSAGMSRGSPHYFLRTTPRRRTPTCMYAAAGPQSRALQARVSQAANVEAGATLSCQTGTAQVCQ